MTNEELKSITSDFSDIKKLIIENNQLLKKTNKNRRRLKTKLEQYSFLKDLVEINNNGTKLVEAVVKFFKAIGFEKVDNIDKNGKEDVRLWTDDTLLIIEVTGIDTPNPKYSKIHQISMHIQNRQREHPNLNVYGLFVVSHDNTKHFSKRNKKPFTKDISEIAESNKYTLATTIDLFNFFINFMQGNLTKLEILEKLCKTGELKIKGI